MANRVIVLCTIVLAILYGFGIAEIRVPQLGDPLGPRVFPILVCIGLFVAAALLVYETFFTKAKTEEVPPAEVLPAEEPPPASARWVVPFTVVASAGYILIFEPLGYPVATSLFLIALISVFRRGYWISNTATAVLFSFATYYLFTSVLHVRLPGGILPT